MATVQLSGRGGVALPPELYREFLKSRRGRMLTTGEESFSPYSAKQIVQSGIGDYLQRHKLNQAQKFLGKKQSEEKITQAEERLTQSARSNRDSQEEQISQYLDQILGQLRGGFGDDVRGREWKDGSLADDMRGREFTGKDGGSLGDDMRGREWKGGGFADDVKGRELMGQLEGYSKLGGSFLQKTSEIKSLMDERYKKIAEAQRNQISQAKSAKERMESMQNEMRQKAEDAYNKMRGEMEEKRKVFEKAQQSQKWWQGVQERSSDIGLKGEMGGGLGWTAGRAGMAGLGMLGGSAVAIPSAGFGLAVTAMEQGVVRPAKKREMQARRDYIEYLKANPDVFKKATENWENKGVVRVGWSPNNELVGIIPRQKAIEMGYIKEKPPMFGLQPTGRSVPGEQGEPERPVYGESVGFSAKSGEVFKMSDQPTVPGWLAKNYPTGGGGDEGVPQPFYSYEEGGWKDPTNLSLVLEEPNPLTWSGIRETQEENMGEMYFPQESPPETSSPIRWRDWAGQRFNEENI